MKLVHRHITVLLVCTIVCVITAGCVVGGHRVWPKIDGVVLDKESGDPIEGAFVTVSYGGDYYYIIESQGTCYKQETIKTNERGQFTVNTKGPRKVANYLKYIWRAREDSNL